MRVHIEEPDTGAEESGDEGRRFEAGYVSVNTGNGFARASFRSYRDADAVSGDEESAEEDVPNLIQLTVKVLTQHGAYSIVHPACGDGNLSAKLAEAGFDVTGFDFAAISSRARRIARNMQRRLVHFLADDPGLPSRNIGSFDGLVAPHVLSQMLSSQRQRFLRNLIRLLRQGGVGVFTAVSAQDDRYGRGQEIEPDTFEIAPGQVVHFFTDEGLLRELDEFFAVFSLEHLVETQMDHRGNTREYACLFAAGMRRD